MDATVVEKQPVLDRRQRAQVHEFKVTERGTPNIKAAIPALADLVEAVEEREEWEE